MPFTLGHTWLVLVLVIIGLGLYWIGQVNVRFRINPAIYIGLFGHTIVQVGSDSQRVVKFR